MEPEPYRSPRAGPCLFPQTQCKKQSHVPPHTVWAGPCLPLTFPSMVVLPLRCGRTRTETPPECQSSCTMGPPPTPRGLPGRLPP